MSNEVKSSKKERKEFREYLSIEDKCVLDVKKYDIDLIADDEIFVLVNNTKNYWISNYGRLINNLRGYFYEHDNTRKKTGKQANASTHYTLSAFTDTGELYKINTYANYLVAEHFLENTSGCDLIYHIDRDKNNCFYKNLIWVSKRECCALYAGNMTVEELGRHQEYIPYVTLKSGKRAYEIWNGIYIRCYRRDDVYDGSFMCDLWKENKDAFAEWWSSEYYEVPGESMAVDKDLLYPGNKEYCPEKCCILPQTLNTMLSNCKKHRLPKNKTSKMNLPLGVRYDSGKNMYYGEIKPFRHDEVVRLRDWNTPEEAFEEYKRHKQADILIMADKYKSKVPKKVYDALLKVEVEMY